MDQDSKNYKKINLQTLEFKIQSFLISEFCVHESEKLEQFFVFLIRFVTQFSNLLSTYLATKENSEV